MSSRTSLPGGAATNRAATKKGAAGAPPVEPAGLSAVAMAVVLTGFALSIADFFIVNVALTTMKHDLHASDAALELVVSGYGITYALGLVMGGRLGDSFGRRRLYGYGLVAFTLTSALCGFAPTVGFLIGARLLQGVAAALLVPQVLGTIQAATAGAARARAISLYGATAGIAAVAGQLIGGLLVWLDVAGTGWRSVFMINVPAGLLALAFLRRMPATRADRRPGLDLTGTALFGLAMVCVLVVIVEGRPLGWPAWLWLLAAVALAATVALVRSERALETRGGSPLLPPSILAAHSMRTGLMAVIPFSVGFGAFMFVYTLVAQQKFGLDALASGALMSPFVSAFFVVSLFTPKIAARLGRRIVSLGAVLQGIGLLLIALLVGTTWPHPPLVLVVLILAFTGVGQALIGPTLLRMVLADVPPSSAGTGSGVLVTSQQTATALGVTVGGTLYLSLVEWAGELSGTVLILALLALFSAVVFGLSLRLPEPR